MAILLSYFNKREVIAKTLFFKLFFHFFRKYVVKYEISKHIYEIFSYASDFYNFLCTIMN